MKNILMVAALVATCAAHGAEPAAEPKYLDPQAPATTCPAGTAVTYTMQCDQGTRAPVFELMGLRYPGASLCRAQRLGCTPISNPGPHPRRGFEVLDSYGPELVNVTWGLERLFGDWPAER